MCVAHGFWILWTNSNSTEQRQEQHPFSCHTDTYKQQSYFAWKPKQSVHKYMFMYVRVVNFYLVLMKIYEHFKKLCLFFQFLPFAGPPCFVCGPVCRVSLLSTASSTCNIPKLFALSFAAHLINVQRARCDFNSSFCF